MFFTEEDYRKIEKWFSHRAIRDTQFPPANPLTGEELIALIQEGENRTTPLQSFVDELNNIKIDELNSRVENCVSLANRIETRFNSLSQDVTDFFNTKGQANGIAPLGTDSRIPSSYLPSYVDDVVEYAGRSNFPSAGESGKIYVAKDTNLTYRWSGTGYVEISPSIALGETSSTAYAGDKGKALADKVNSHIANRNNPHSVTKSQIGLGNVDNTSDANKPVSTAQEQRIQEVENSLNTHVSSLQSTDTELSQNISKNSGDIATLNTNLASTNGNVSSLSSNMLSNNREINKLKIRVSDAPYYVHIKSTTASSMQDLYYHIGEVTLEEDSTPSDTIKELISDSTNNAKFHVEGTITTTIDTGGTLREMYVNGIISQYHGILVGQIKDTFDSEDPIFLLVEIVGFSNVSGVLCIKSKATPIRFNTTV